MTRKPIKWRGDVRTFDRYQLHEAYLWGAKSALYPGSARGPVHPTLFEEYNAGAHIAVAGYIRMSADADPKEIVRRLKQEHQLKADERARVA